MALSITTYINQIQPGQPRIPSPIANALQAIQNWASAGLVDADIGSSAAIAMSKINLTYSDWTAWVPTWDTNGAGTVPVNSVSFARYKRIGNTVFFKIDATVQIQNSDAATTAIRFTLPVNTTAVAHTFTVLVKDPADTTVLVPGHAIHIHATAANKVYVYKTFSSTTAVSV
jgi:hypothetical protein